jgi:hypothetical protein
VADVLRVIPEDERHEHTERHKHIPFCVPSWVRGCISVCVGVCFSPTVFASTEFSVCLNPADVIPASASASTSAPPSPAIVASARGGTRLLNSGPFIKILLHNHSVNINIIIFFFRRSKRNFSLFYFASQES